MNAPATTAASPSLAARVLMGLVRLYQLALSPWLGGACRFEPSCSRYAMSSLETHGALRGSLLSLVRLSKCHPFHPGGYDPPVGRVVGHAHVLGAAHVTHGPPADAADPRPADR